MSRPSRLQVSLMVVQAISKRATCLRRQVGAVIVVDNRVVSMGYNGPPSHVVHCTKCLKEDAPSGTGLDLCPAVHAEINAILQAAKFGVSVQGGTLICSLQPCFECLKMIISAGIKEVIYETSYQPTNPKLYYRVVYQSGIKIHPVNKKSQIIKRTKQNG